MSPENKVVEVKVPKGKENSKIDPSELLIDGKHSLPKGNPTSQIAKELWEKFTGIF